MRQISSGRSVICQGAEALEHVLHVAPRRSSAALGWTDLRVCSWSACVDEYRLPAVPELIVALHTAGQAVDRCNPAAGRNSRSVPGLGTIRPPGVADRYRTKGRFGCTTAHVAIPRVRAVAEALGDRNLIESIPCRFGISDALLSATMEALAREIETPAECGSLLAEHLMDALIIHVLRGGRSLPMRRVPGGLSPSALSRVCDRIEAGLASAISVSELASEVQLSPFHFSRAFKNATGRAPHRYLTERRIERAKLLLLHGDMPITRVALESGFTSQQHFTGTFRRFTGSPPAAYRRLQGGSSSGAPS